MLGPTVRCVVNMLPIQCLFEDINVHLYNIRNGEILEHGLYPSSHWGFFNFATAVEWGSMKLCDALSFR
jgi:hypothetical protein